MARSRTARLATTRRFRRKRVVVLGILGAALLLVAVFVVVRSISAGPRSAVAEVGATPAATAGTLAVSTATTATAMELIEVPKVVGSPLREAEIVLSAVGLKTMRVARGTVDDGAPVAAQDPPAGTKIERGSTVKLSMDAPGEPPKPERQPVVVIDPGHQLVPDTRPEPLGPGSRETKERATAGATGVVTGQPEHRVALDVANRVAPLLREAGVRVLMTRTVADVDLSNASRARMANDAHAELFVRVHADDSSDRNTRGVSTLYPARNDWTAPIESRSLRAARLVQTALVASTGAHDRGLSPRGDMCGFNWSKVPAVLVETGMLSNPEDDRALSTEAYQDRVAQGIARGILEYLGMATKESR